MDTFTIDDHRLAVTIIRTARRTTRLNLISAAQIEVRAPLTKSDNDIMELLSKQRSWIASLLPKLSLPISRVLPETTFLRGRELPIRHNVKPNSKIAVTHDEDSFSLTYPPETPAIDLRYALIQHYRQTAKLILTEKTDFWAEKIGVTYNRITIKEQQTCWGSCSPKHNLNYNWRIIQAPDEVIDYLVIHELCHLRHMNHSQAFWQTVSMFDPNYAEHRRQLPQIQSRIPAILP